MKNKFSLIALILLALYLPVFAHADGTVTVSTSCDPTYANQDDEVYIIITAHNNTDNIITINSYAINDVWYPIQPIDVRPNNDLELKDIINVDFLGADYAVILGLGISFDIGYDNGNYALYGNDVIVNKNNSALGNPPVDASVFFDVKADTTNIEAGTWVNYTITCTNTGSIEYTQFQVFTKEQSIDIFDLSVGTTKTINYSKQYFNTSSETFGYFYLYYDGNDRPTVYVEDAQKFNISVNAASTQAPVTTSTPQPTDASNPTNTPESSSNPNDSASSKQGQTDQQQASITQAPVDSDQQSAQEVINNQSSALNTNTTNHKNSLISIILYIEIGLIIVGLFVILVILLKRLKTK